MPEQMALRWATRADIPAMADIFVKIGLNFELHDHFMKERHLHQGEYYNYLLHRIRMFWARPGFRFLVMEHTQTPDAEGDCINLKEIVGFAAWEYSGPNMPLEWHDIDDTWWNMFEGSLLAAERVYHRLFVNRIIDVAGMNQVLSTLHTPEDSAMTALHLQYLFVHPDWQRGPHRIGHTLLQWGIDLADRLETNIIIVCSLAGYPFYLKHGFELLRKVRVDLVPALAYDVPVVIRRAANRKAQV